MKPGSGVIFADPLGIDLTTREGKAQFLGAIQHFAGKTNALEGCFVEAGVRELTVAGDFPAEVRDLFLKFHNRYGIDTSWQPFFDMRDYTASNRAGFTLRNVSSGWTFTELKPGRKVKLYKVSGTETYHKFLHYAGGLEYDEDWYQDQDWWAIENQTMEGLATYYRAVATCGYALITGIAAGQNTAWAAGATTLERDIATINAACVAILADAETNKTPIEETDPFIIRAAPSMKERLNRALRETGNERGLEVEFNVTAGYTQRLTGTNYYLGVGGKKNVWGTRMNLTVLGKELDIISWARAIAGHARFKGVIGDEDQIRRCAGA